MIDQHWIFILIKFLWILLSFIVLVTHIVSTVYSKIHYNNLILLFPHSLTLYLYSLQSIRVNCIWFITALNNAHSKCICSKDTTADHMKNSVLHWKLAFTYNFFFAIANGYRSLFVACKLMFECKVNILHNDRVYYFVLLLQTKTSNFQHELQQIMSK